MPADQRVTDLLLELQRDCRVSLDHASDHLRNKGESRNQMAQQAAADHRNRSEALMGTWCNTKNPHDVIQELRQCRDHAEYWVRKFAEWCRKNEYKHAYAKFIHEEAATR